MIFKLLFALLPIALVLLSSEILWRKEIIQGERARKFIHILAGVWMAFWPFYIPFDGIFVLGCMALTLVIYSRNTKVFHAIYAVKRKTYGDILYALAIILCSYWGVENWVFTVSILTLALADGGAAVAGKLWGSSNIYRVFGNKQLTKSIAGTASFIVLSIVCVLVGYVLGGNAVMQDYILLSFVFVPIVSAAVENIMPYGFDNLAIPVFITLIFNSIM